MHMIKIYTKENDLVNGRPIYELIVEKALELGIAGASAFRGILGYGAHSHLHSAKLLCLSDDLPVVVEIVDSSEKLDNIAPFIKEVVKDGIAVRVPVEEL